MEFKKYKLNDLLETKTQGVNTTTDNIKYVNHGIKIIQAKNISKYDYTFDNENYVSEKTYSNMRENHKLHNGEVLFTNIGSQLGNSAVYDSDEPAIITWNVLKLIPNQLINNYFLCYYLNHKSNYIKTLNSSSTMPFVSGQVLLNIDCEIPELENQKKIVKIVKTINNKIKLNNQINNNLYELTNNLYEEKFVKNRDENWNEYNLLDLADITNGYSYTGKELTEKSNLGLVTIKNFDRNGKFKEDGFKPIIPIKNKEQHFVNMFDILVACTDLTQNADIIGNAVMLLNTNKYEKTIISMDLVKVIPKTNHFMLFSILNSKEFKNHALGYKSGTTVLHLNKNCFKDFNIKLPNEEIMTTFEKIVESNFKKISANLKENQLLSKLRDTLLPKLMNGAIDLDSIEV